MASKSGSKKASKRVETLVHDDASRTNIPSAEHQSVVGDDIAAAVAVAYERRNRDLDPQLVWRGKDTQDLSDLVVNAPPLYIQERVHPKAIIEDLKGSRDGGELPRMTRSICLPTLMLSMSDAEKRSFISTIQLDQSG